MRQLTPEQVLAGEYVLLVLLVLSALLTICDLGERIYRHYRR